MRAAAIQFNSTDDKQRNLAAAERLVRAAVADGAVLVVLPEKFNFLGEPEPSIAAAEPLDGPTIEWARGLAGELGIDLVAGSIPEQTEVPGRRHNTSVHVGPDGEIKAVYRKLHLFDVDVAGTIYRESDTESPGEDIVLTRAGDAEIGMAICYDVRFPELFRALALGGARVLVLPAAFTLETTRDQWEVMVRARAIENQCFVVAANQFGLHPPGLASGGRSLIVDPWGEVLARAGEDGEAVVAAELDFARQDEIRAAMPLLSHRRPAAYAAAATVNA